MRRSARGRIMFRFLLIGILVALASAFMAPVAPLQSTRYDVRVTLNGDSTSACSHPASGFDVTFTSTAWCDDLQLSADVCAGGEDIPIMETN